jgi:hypothetical protein
MWKAFAGPVGRLIPHFNTLAAGGGNLAEILLGRVEPPPGKMHARVVRNTLTWPAPSQLAQSDDAMEKLWRDSAKLVGFTG